MDSGTTIEIGKTEEGTDLGEENPIPLGHVKFEISLRHMCGDVHQTSIRQEKASDPRTQRGKEDWRFKSRTNK